MESLHATGTTVYAVNEPVNYAGPGVYLKCSLDSEL